MDAEIENQQEDTGTLVVTLDLDDDVALNYENRSVRLRLPLYAYQARDLIDALAPLAAAEDLR